MFKPCKLSLRLHNVFFFVGLRYNFANENLIQTSKSSWKFCVNKTKNLNNHKTTGDDILNRKTTDSIIQFRQVIIRTNVYTLIA